MGKKATLIFVAFFLAVGHQSTASALSIGQATVLSSLNEPLNARIPLLVFQEEDLETLKISVKLSEASVAVGQFQISHELVKEQEHAYIKLSSKEAVREPALSFILVLEWLGGQFRRNYSFLINPPQP